MQLGEWGNVLGWYAREDSNLWPLAPEADTTSRTLSGLFPPHHANSLRNTAS